VADIAPFRGIRYDTARVDASKVLAPPYDVIDPAQRAALAASDPHNVVRLILPEPDAVADDGGDRYAAAARTFAAWQAEGVLVRDASRCIYRYHQIFRSPEHDGRLVTRRGFIAGVRLEPFSAGVILPHERTLAGPKADRLALMKATHAHFSQIFTLFQDPGGEVERLFRRVDDRSPDVEGTTGDGVVHRLWRIADAELIGKLRRLFAPKKLVIADGHHRYETMLALREHLAAGRELDQYSAAHYGSMFLVSTDDPGLVVFPTHRLVHGLPEVSPAALLARARETFMVERLPGAARDPQRIRDAISRTPGHQPSFAAVFAGEPDAWQLTLEPSVNLAAAGVTGHAAVARLDVTLLHGLVLDRLLGITPAAQEAQTNLRYSKDTAGALAEVEAGRAQIAFLLNPTRVEQVRHVAEVGEVMPQKSTFFYPKLASGLVMASIDPDEDLI
jgi:uncharacterized protein (DUF1015 family)